MVKEYNTGKIDDISGVKLRARLRLNLKVYLGIVNHDSSSGVSIGIFLTMHQLHFLRD